MDWRVTYICFINKKKSLRNEILWITVKNGFLWHCLEIEFGQKYILFKCSYLYSAGQKKVWKWNHSKDTINNIQEGYLLFMVNIVKIFSKTIKVNQ